jgi:antitoxin HicB
MQNIYRLPLVLEPQPEGGYTITCPLLPELITEADTLDDVLPNVSDALAAVIESYEDTKQPLPEILKPLNPNSPLWAETLVTIRAA